MEGRASVSRPVLAQRSEILRGLGAALPEQTEDQLAHHTSAGGDLQKHSRLPSVHSSFPPTPSYSLFFDSMEQAYPGGDDHGYGFRRGPDSRQAERAVFDGKRMRKPVARKTVDYNASMARYLHQRLFRACGGQRAWNWKRPWLQHSMDSVRNLQIVAHYGSHPANAFTSKFVQLAANKGLRRPVHCVEWSPDARRVWTGSHSGELTVWNGLQFNFESILQAHSQPIRAMTWSHNDDWLLTGDNGGIIKYWQSTMNNVKEIVAHGESVRSISFAPSDLKFVSCSDDRTCKIWDFNTCREEVVFRGHGWDVKSVSWHPRKGIVASGGKDNLIKIWDPKTGNELAALHGHKNTITRVQWNKNGNWFLSSSRDQLLKLWDIRFLKEIESFRGHNADVHCKSFFLHMALQFVF